MRCWLCHWGWHEDVMEIYREAIDKINEIDYGRGDECLKYGPAHVVWSDENFDNACIKSAIEDCEEKNFCSNINSEEELRVVKESLEKLLEVPEDKRFPWPSEWESASLEAHPKNFPPENPEKLVSVNSKLQKN